VLYIFQRDIGKWAQCIRHIRNQLIAWGNTHNLLQTRVPGLEFRTWCNLACAAFWTYQSMNYSLFSRVPSASAGIFLCIVDTENTSWAHSCANTRPCRTDTEVLPSRSLRSWHSDILSRCTWSENYIFQEPCSAATILKTARFFSGLANPSQWE
jgi:hypothetical protein